MPLDADPRKITKAWVITWETEPGMYGIAYETSDRQSGAALIGTKAQAEAIVSGIQGTNKPAEVALFPKDIAAS
jgi:hypothetical protein